MNKFFTAILPRAFAQRLHLHEWSKWCEPYERGVLAGHWEQKRYCIICNRYEIRNFYVNPNLDNPKP